MKTLSDPPAWWYPVRRSYAAALLAQGKPRAALKQASRVLARRSNDPVALSIRADAEEALGMKDAAAADRAAALRDWRGDKAQLAPALA
jgi:predicted Zn-dependent protease